MAIYRQDLSRAYSRTARFRSVTPLVRVPFLEERWKCQLYVKCDQFQEIGAFKIRGAANFALQLSDEERKKGLVTHSSGNHAQAVAFMAKQLGVKAFIVMPDNSNRVKIGNAEKWGAEISLCAPTIEARLAAAERLAETTGGRIIPPFDHPWIVAGQATCAMEVFSEWNDVDVLVAPLGGGGLLAGSALAAKHFSNRTKIIGAEPEQAQDGYLGFTSGVREERVTANTVADGLRTTVGVTPFQIIKDEVQDVWLAPEDRIVPWMYTMWKETKLLMEPSSAVPFAAMEEHQEKLRGKKVVVIITGGNVDLAHLPVFST
ncbi:MAG: threonine/serine dehydratase [Flavobacteriales bacterium]|nr:threonine/serine dehydratase [Flavobacteriales bacterium]